MSLFRLVIGLGSSSSIGGRAVPKPSGPVASRTFLLRERGLLTMVVLVSGIVARYYSVISFQRLPLLMLLLELSMGWAW